VSPNTAKIPPEGVRAITPRSVASISNWVVSPGPVTSLIFVERSTDGPGLIGGTVLNASGVGSCQPLRMTWSHSRSEM
jgi:hypothetical protein